MPHPQEISTSPRISAIALDIAAYTKRGGEVLDSFPFVKEAITRAGLENLQHVRLQGNTSNTMGIAPGVFEDVSTVRFKNGFTIDVLSAQTEKGPIVRLYGMSRRGAASIEEPSHLFTTSAGFSTSTTFFPKNRRFRARTNTNKSRAIAELKRIASLPPIDRVFTADADLSASLVVARQIAHQSEHCYIGSTHVVFGCLCGTKQVGSLMGNTTLDFDTGLMPQNTHSLMVKAGLSAEKIWADIRREIADASNMAPGGSLITQDPSPRLEKAISYAKEEASLTDETLVSPGHMLLGIVRVGAGKSFRVLRRNGFNADEFRNVLASFSAERMSRHQTALKTAI